jgi:hypothetical protein
MTKKTDDSIFSGITLDPPPPWGDMYDAKKYDNLMRYALERGVTLELEHIEMMAAAYFQKTDIDPREVALVREQRGWGETVWYFITRDELKERGIL